MVIPEGIQTQVDLKNYTSWLVGGKADYFAEPSDIDELKDIYLWAINNKIQVVVLGGGSNVLISDQGIKGLVIVTSKLNKFSFFDSSSAHGFSEDVELSGGGQEERFYIQAEVGVKKAALLKLFLKNQLAPALFLAGLPGELGGGIIMNAGVSESIYPKEFEHIIDWIEVLRPSGSIERLNQGQLEWSYRHLNNWAPGIVVKAQMSCPRGVDVSILEKVKLANQLRLLRQPLDRPSCGSVFKNPTGLKAAQLIDNAGLKGYSIGGAQVSDKHANFIINTGGALAKDIWKVINDVKQKVKQTYNVELETEVVKLGEWSD